MASTYLTRAASGSVTSQTTYTFSFWIKRNLTGVRDTVFMHESASGHTQKLDLHFDNNDNWLIGHYDGTNEYNVKTNMKFRDCNGWYHIVTRIDTTQSTESDRYRIYVNGNQVDLTESGSGYPAQNSTLNLGQHPLVYGRYQASSPSGYFSGGLSHCHYCDGQSYAPTEFGQYDANGVWTIKTSPSVTYGTNGHFMFKDNNSVTDQSGNGNNFTVAGGTLTNTEDCPSNVFCVFSPIDIPINSSGTTRTIHNLSNGNLTLINTNSDYREARSTFYLTEGKWYWEAKSTREGGSQSAVGVVLNSYAAGSGQRRLYQHNAKKYDDGGSSDYGATWTTNDIIGVALNLDDGEITFYKNGTSQGVAFTDLLTDIDNTGWTPFFASYNGDMSFNFGNGYFGSTPVSSAGTNASGIGIFEFDVPTGFTSLSTKGLNL